jgi:hypothetical protein
MDDGWVLVIEKLLSLQVCVPDFWSAEQVVRVTNKHHLCGTTFGWVISRRVENPVTCANDESRRHWVLDA